MRRLVEGACDIETLAAHAGVSYSRICRLIGEFVIKGSVEIIGKVGNRKLYALAAI
jgi:hypothetical protein